MRKRNSGFTLIELLVVMAVIALLLTIALPRYFGSLDLAKERALRDNLKVLRVTLDRFYTDHGYFPASLADLVTQKYLRAVPIDPITQSASTWIEIPAADTDSTGIADVKSGAAGADKEGVAYVSL